MSVKWSTHHYVVNTLVRNDDYLINSDYTRSTWLYNYSTIYPYQYIFIDESCQQFNIYCLKYIYVDFVTEDSIPYNGSLKPDARFT